MTELEPLFDKLQRALSCVCLVSPSLRIKGRSTDVLAKSQGGHQVPGRRRALHEGRCRHGRVLRDVTADAFTCSYSTVDAAGTLRDRMGTEALTLGGVTFPTIPDGEVVTGFVIINPTGTGNFVGGTTELDDATVVSDRRVREYRLPVPA
jgi:hypothetical protein